jgi:cell division protein FtsA
MIIDRINKKKVNKAKKESYLAIDIGTEYVKSVVFIEEDGDIQVVGYNKMKQKESNMYAAFIINLNEVIDTVDKSIGEAIALAKPYLEAGYSLPKKAVIGIAGELVQGVTVLVNLDRENADKIIDQNEIEQIIQNVKENTFESTKEEIALEIGIKSHQVQEIDTYINSVFIDGVRVTNPLGYKGSELVYRVFSTFAPKIHIESTKQVLNSLGLQLHKLVVEPYALTLALQDLRNTDGNGIIIDIGGGTTDVALVQNGDIIGTKMFAIGGRVFTRRIEKEFGISYEKAEEMKIKYSNGKLTEAESEKIRRFYEKDVKTWLTGVEISLQDFEDVSEYPSSIYLCGGGALLPEIQEGLMSHPWLQILNFKKFPKVNFSFPNNVNSVIDKTKLATTPGDVTPLALARMILVD